ncbi:MAG: AAA family ATPase [Prevotellaceae bacterium]|nr:AAA family ATPase [Candidatus Faecinaster equi]
MKYATYIKSVEINGLWGDKKHIVWNLRPDTNILSGVNGVGKSTILNKIITNLHSHIGDIEKGMTPGGIITLYPEDADAVRYDVIRSFDSTLIPANVIAKIADGNVRSELDWKLYELQRKYLDYQVNLANKMIEVLSSNNEDSQQNAIAISRAKTDFQDILDSLFTETQKTIDRTCNELQFIQFGEKISTYKLSSGEKQLLIILLTVLLEDNQPYVLIMDEPETSLHIDWQEKLLATIHRLNPNAQIILTTHSPAMIMNGWLDAVTEVNDITIKDNCEPKD